MGFKHSSAIFRLLLHKKIIKTSHKQKISSKIRVKHNLTCTFLIFFGLNFIPRSRKSLIATLRISSFLYTSFINILHNTVFRNTALFYFLKIQNLYTFNNFSRWRWHVKCKSDNCAYAQINNALRLAKSKWWEIRFQIIKQVVVNELTDSV